MGSLREGLAYRIGGDQLREHQRMAELTQQALAQNGLLVENLEQLEQAIQGDEGWRRLTWSMEHDFSRTGLDSMIDVSRAMYLNNPLIQRAVNVNTYYTWAQGYAFKAKEDRIQEEVVDPQSQDETNRIELYSHQARLLTDVDQMVEGNVFLALFTSDFGDVQIRSIPSKQIRDIITHPQDALQVWFYHRVWTQSEFDTSDGTIKTVEYEAYYPDIHHNPNVKPESIGGKQVFWDAPVVHQRTGGLKHMQFGVPQTYAALDWARAYKKFLEDWHTVVASLARFAWRASVKGSKAQKLKDRLKWRRESELGENETDSDTAGPPVAGAMWADQADLTPINKSGAYTSAADAKQSRLMVGAAMDLPDTILSGDPQQGNLATAQTLDRPTELGMRSRQTLWADMDARMWRYTIDAKVRRGRLPGRIVRTAEGSEVEPGLDPTVLTIFPPILEHDPSTTVQSIVNAATLQGKPEAGLIPRPELAKLLMNAVGVEDVEKALDELGDLEQDDLAMTMAQLARALGATTTTNGGPPAAGDEDDAVARGQEQ